MEWKSIDLSYELPLTSGAQPEIFQGRGGFLKLGHFDKHYIKKSRKKAQRKMLEFFLLDTLRTFLKYFE